MRTYSDRTVTITLTIQEWNLAYVAANVGSRIFHGLTDLFVIEESVEIDEDGIGVLPRPAIGRVSVKTEDGRRFEVEPSEDNTIDLSEVGITDECVTVTFQFEAEAKVVNISADESPWIGQLILHGTISDNRMGEIGKLEVDIPSFALDGYISNIAS